MNSAKAPVGKRRFGLTMAFSAASIVAALNFGWAPVAAAGDGASAPTALEEVVVTAQKKAERAQDIGISMTALSGQDIVNQGILDVTDVSNAAPSVQFNRFSESDVVINIRGVAQNDYGDQQEPPIAVYQDDSYASTLNLSGFPLFDLERVEVLRGPQGTLFGRNATGGAVQFISAKPTRYFESSVTGTVGSFSEADATGSISGPLSESVSARLAVNSINHSSYLKNLADGGGRGGVKRLATRAHLAFEPSETFKGMFTIRYAHDGPDSDAGLYTWTPSYVDSATGTGLYLLPTSPDPNPWGTCPGCDYNGYRNDAINPQLGGDPWTVNNFGTARMNRTIMGSSLHLDAMLGGMTLTSVSDFQRLNKSYQEGDWGTGGVALVQFNQSNNTSQFTQELRLSGDTNSNSWMVGAFYMGIRGRYAGTYSFPLFDYVPVVQFSQNTNSVAIFGQNEFKLGDGWKLITGLRGWRDQRTMNYSAYDNTGAYPATDPILFNPTTAPGIADKTFRDFSAKIAIERRLNKDLMAYLSFNRGTKSGGFEGPVATPGAGLKNEFLATLPYGSERLYAYELGMKSTMMDNRLRLNADVFYYNYKGFQAFEQIGVLQSIKNLDAKEWGIEAEVLAKPITGLTFSLSASSLHSTVYDVTMPSLLVRDTRLPQAPGLSLNGYIRYEHPVGEGVASVQISGRRWNEFCWSTFCGQVDVESPGYAADLRLGYEWRNLTFSGSVTNLTNRKYRVYEVDTAAFSSVISPIYAPPRWYLFSVTAKFGGKN